MVKFEVVNHPSLIPQWADYEDFSSENLIYNQQGESTTLDSNQPRYFIFAKERLNYSLYEKLGIIHKIGLAWLSSKNTLKQTLREIYDLVSNRTKKDKHFAIHIPNTLSEREAGFYCDIFVQTLAYSKPAVISFNKCALLPLELLAQNHLIVDYSWSAQGNLPCDLKDLLQASETDTIVIEHRKDLPQYDVEKKTVINSDAGWIFDSLYYYFNNYFPDLNIFISSLEIEIIQNSYASHYYKNVNMCKPSSDRLMEYRYNSPLFSMVIINLLEKLSINELKEIITTSNLHTISPHLFAGIKGSKKYFNTSEFSKNDCLFYFLRLDKAYPKEVITICNTARELAEALLKAQNLSLNTKRACS